MQDVTHWTRDICGVYFLYLNDELVYIGQSTHIPSRVRTHAKIGKIRFNKVMATYCLKEELNALEHRLLQQHKPRENIRQHNYGGHGKPKPPPPVPSPSINLAKLGITLNPKRRM